MSNEFQSFQQSSQHNLSALKRAEFSQRLLVETYERNRLAQELHENVAQTLGYLNLQMSQTHTLLTEGKIDQAAAQLQELKKVVGEVYTEVREEIFNLRTQSFSGLSFLELLHEYIDKYKRFYNLDIQLVKEADETLLEFPPEVGPQVIRTIQETLINVRKHAQVNQAIIRLSLEGRELCISVEDQGQGFDPVQMGDKEGIASFGLQIMRERVASAGGKLEIKSGPGKGTRVILRYLVENITR